ncbi:MAG: DUF2153 family protein [Candidatus Bathyarchaeota archaeon]
MNSTWIDRSEKTIEQLRLLKDKRDMDRLDLLKSMRFSFSALSQSLGGWMQWVNSPEVMSQFNRDELQEMSDRIIDMVTGFIEYDLDVTDRGMQKGLGKQRDEDQSRFVI